MRGHSVPWLSGLEKRQERLLVFGSQPCFWLREEKSTNGSHQIGLQQLSQHFGNKSSHYLNNVKTVFPDQLLFETFGGWWGEELISSSLSWCPFSAFSSCSMRMPDMLAAHVVICVLHATEGGRLSLVSPQTWEWQCPGVQWTREFTFTHCQWESPWIHRKVSECPGWVWRATLPFLFSGIFDTAVVGKS